MELENSSHSWQTVPVFYTLIVRKPLVSNLNQPSFSLKPLPLFLSTQSAKRSVLLLLTGSLQRPQLGLFSRLKNPSPQGRCSSSLVIFVALKILNLSLLTSALCLCSLCATVESWSFPDNFLVRNGWLL